MDKELKQLRDSHNNYKEKLRDMELDNDELENAERWVEGRWTVPSSIRRTRFADLSYPLENIGIEIK